MNEQLSWVYCRREQLAEYLQEGSSVHFLPRPRSFSKSELKEYGVGIGLKRAIGAPDAFEISAFVVSSDLASDVFAWLDVYAPDVFPISQFGRVLSVEDWELSNELPRLSEGASFREVWSSVVMGEILSQSDAREEIEDVPMSRAIATYSAAMARAQLSGERMVRTCADRLRAIEFDRRFVQRAVSVDMLTPIWALAASPDRHAFDDPTEVVVNLLAALPMWQRLRGDESPLHLLDLYPELAGSSVEDRVVAFRRLEADVSAPGSPARDVQSASTLLACGAFLVGRGSSHYFLLGRLGRRFPLASAWFGLLCGILGRKCWSLAWSRAVSAIGRQLSAPASVTSLPTADLSWLEYQWLTKARERSDQFSGVAKLYPRLLQVEVLPGINSQFRFEVEDGDSVALPHQFTEEQRVSLLQVLDLLNIGSQKINSVLKNQAPGHEEQQRLFEGAVRSPASKKKR